MVPFLVLFYCLPWTLNILTISKLQSPARPILTNAIQNPANGPISSAGQDTEVWSITEKVQPGSRRKAKTVLFTRLWLAFDTLLGSETSPLFPSLPWEYVTSFWG